jgi:hypothetical protein
MRRPPASQARSAEHGRPRPELAARRGDGALSDCRFIVVTTWWKPRREVEHAGASAGPVPILSRCLDSCEPFGARGVLSIASQIDRAHRVPIVAFGGAVVVTIERPSRPPAFFRHAGQVPKATRR